MSGPEKDCGPTDTWTIAAPGPKPGPEWLAIFRHPLERTDEDEYIVQDRHGDFYLFEHSRPTSEWPRLITLPAGAEPDGWAVKP